jgi:hypothetical protein
MRKKLRESAKYVFNRVTWKLTDIDYPACLSHVEFDYYDTVYNESISKQAMFFIHKGTNTRNFNSGGLIILTFSVARTAKIVYTLLLSFSDIYL